MHHGCVAGANDGREGSGGVVADIAKLSVGREAYYTRELATDHEQYLSGHGETPGRWYEACATSLGLEGEASVAGFEAMFEGRHPDSGELLAGTGADRPVVAVRVRASVGRPGGSAQARWRQERAAAWLAWTRTLPWRVAAALGIEHVRV